MKKIPFGKPILGQEEKEAVMKVMDGSLLVHGPVSVQFEKEEYPAKSKRKGALISFIDSLINANKSAMILKTEIFNTMSVCFAAEKSIKTGKAVEIDYLN